MHPEISKCLKEELSCNSNAVSSSMYSNIDDTLTGNKNSFTNQNIGKEIEGVLLPKKETPSNLTINHLIWAAHVNKGYEGVTGFTSVKINFQKWEQSCLYSTIHLKHFN